jgi:hypothetical protein
MHVITRSAIWTLSETKFTRVLGEETGEARIEPQMLVPIEHGYDISSSDGLEKVSIACRTTVCICSRECVRSIAIGKDYSGSLVSKINDINRVARTDSSL